MVLGLDDPTLPRKATYSLHGLYAGNYLTGVFYGLTTHQAFVYFQRSENDPLNTRLLVLFLWILDTLHSVSVAIALFEITKESINNPLGLLINRIPWEISFSLIMMTVSDCCVRGFYCHRVWKLSNHNVILTGLAAFSIICALIAGLYSSCKTVGVTGLEAFGIVIEIDLTVIAICISDSILTGSLCVLLWNSRSSVRRTNSLISTLILYTVTSGLLTTLVAIMALILLLTLRDTFAYGGAFYILGKLYFSSLLATLNRREMFRTKMESSTGGFFSISLADTTHSSGGNEVGMPVFASADDVNAGTNSEAQTKMRTRRGTMNAVSVVSTNADAVQDGYANIKVETHVATVV